MLVCSRMEEYEMSRISLVITRITYLFHTKQYPMCTFSPCLLQSSGRLQLKFHISAELLLAFSYSMTRDRQGFTDGLV